MRVTMMLADHASASEGKLYINGGGWSVTGPNPTPSAIAILVQVPWDQTNRRHRMRLELLDADGGPVVASDPANPENEAPVRVEGEFEVGRPPGLPQGVPIDMPLAINLGPIALQPGSRYTWLLHIDDETREDWRVSFSTRPA